MCQNFFTLKVFAVLAVIGGITLSGCGEQPENIPDSRPPAIDAGLDGTTVETDAADLCQDAYRLVPPNWLCGEPQFPDNYMMWTTTAPTWPTKLRAQPTPEMCQITLPGNMESPMDYRLFHVERAGATGPLRFYFRIAGGQQFVCHDPTTLPQPA